MDVTSADTHVKDILPETGEPTGPPPECVHASDGIQSEQSFKHVPLTEISPDQNPQQAALVEAVFTPIKAEDASTFSETEADVGRTPPNDACTYSDTEASVNPPNDDSNSRKMSREDIETMEIMQNECVNDTGIKENSWPNTPDTGNETPTDTPISSHAQEIPSANEDSMASSTTIRNTDPILKQCNMFSSIVAGDLIEYQWPADDGGDYYMLQEQISTFLGITSFKRKYPEIDRRKLDPQELNHLMLNMLVSEVQVTLGLTAVRSRDVCDMMMREYPEKYQEYTQVLDEKRKESIKKKHLQYSAPTVEKSQMPNYLKKAMKQVSEFNARLNRQRKDDFSVYYDLQTNVLQFPKDKLKKLLPAITKPSLYPCALIPGQFQEYCQKYKPDELNYFPLNTVVYGPPPPPPPDIIESVHGSDSEREAEESKETETADTRSEKSQEEGKEEGEGVANKNQEEGATADAIPSGPTISNQDDKNVASSGTSKPLDENSDQAATDTSAVKEEADESLMSYIEDPDKPICGICLKDETCNKSGDAEDLISCSQCDNYGHPSCLDMSKELVSVIVTYNWQCLECKTCTYCSKPHHEDKMMFCDRCDRGYHTFCVGLRNLPSGLWMCPQCTRSDPDFAKRGGRRGSSGTPRKRKNTEPGTTPDSSVKPKRKRRTKRQMEEAREKERQEKEEKLKKRMEKKGEIEERKKKRRHKKEKSDDKKKAESSFTNEMESQHEITDGKIENEDEENDQTEDSTQIDIGKQSNDPAPVNHDADT